MPVNEYGQMIGEPVRHTWSFTVACTDRSDCIRHEALSEHASDRWLFMAQNHLLEKCGTHFSFQPPVENLEELT